MSSHNLAAELETIGGFYASRSDQLGRIQSFNEGVEKSIDLVRKHRLAIEEKNLKPEDGFHYFIQQAHLRRYDALEAELEEFKIHL